jgi:orotate phosphoribosyltransferase
VRRSALAAAIRRSAYVRGTFRLRSGKTATEYFDKYRFESDPVLLRAVAEALMPLIPKSTEVLGGLELGGVPLATILSQLSNLPVVFVRKQAKEYGTAQLAEGAEVKGRRIAVIEDVLTTGGQVLESVAALRTLGASISDVICVIDRDAGANKALSVAQLTLHSLFRYRDLVPGGPAPADGAA